ncbi:hypothetical protein Vau01_107240 [Virgisporangium aurantiacum]|uniref:Uncharacterized protein n=1 Tax=Virgisporangium aurantiacum TaxID=175570 RepID=A0A8J4E6I8_9ACTN|nr:hypothetical protein [Virgisporangium aurantiacum]GIJ63208.1 hypothetical protein Vau01_107240 [Virgisporangium aurantiacum]
MRDTHGGTMAPIAIGAMAALTGLFAVLDARAADRRLILAGLRVPVLLTARLGLIGLSAGLVTVVSLAATAFVFEPRQWPVYAAANLLVAAVYALVGVVLAPFCAAVVKGGEEGSNSVGFGQVKVCVEGQGVLVVMAGESVVAEGVVGVAEAGVGAGPLVPVAVVGGGGVVGEGVGDAAGGVGGLAEAVERPGFAEPVAGLAEDGQGLLMVFGGPAGLAEAGVKGAEAVQGPGFAGAVSEVPEQDQRVL